MGQLNPDSRWWKEGVIYQIYPRSFYDASGDGVGDLPGITAKLEYLKNLGVSGIWISPINESPMFDFGYDISDYRKIDPVFGSMEDFRELVREAHGRGIGVVMDMVLNHSSHLHPWFMESRSSRDSRYRDFYTWKDPAPGGGPPNRWKGAFGGSAWTFDETTGQYYLHSFLPEQPDLNWRNPRCRQALFSELRFWLDEGVDGFRLDVINLIGKDPEFRNNPFSFGWPPRPYEMERHIHDRNHPDTHLFLKELRAVLDGYPGSFAVGEIFLDQPVDQDLAASFTGKGDELHLAFDFSFTFNSWSASSFASILEGQYRASSSYGGTPCFVFSNHDVERAVSRYGGGRNRDAISRLLGLILLSQGGTPFLYMGEELGMENGPVPHSRLADPVGKRYWPFHKGRDGERLPMQWSGRAGAGFSADPSAEAWLPLHPDWKRVNAADQTDADDSLFSLFRNLISLRKKSGALRTGGFSLFDTGNDSVLSYRRESLDGKESLLVLVNFVSRSVEASLPPGSWESLFSTREHRLTDSGTRACLEERIILRPLEGLILNRCR